MKLSEIKGNVVKKGIIGGMVAILIFLGACENETETPEFKNVERELALDGLENVLRESGAFFAKTDQHRTTDKGDAFQTALKPALANSKKLLRTYGISEDFLKTEFKDPNDPRIVLAGLWLLAAERQNEQAPTINRAQVFDLTFFAQENSLDEAQPDWMECMLIAVGVDAIIEFAKGNITETIAKKAIRKIASRTLGWVGVALALYEYGNCMGWY